MESLQATIEKLRADAEAFAKRVKANEKRLLMNLKEQLASGEEQAQLILALEKDKMELLESLATSGVVPILSNKRLANEVSRRARSSNGRSSYVEEVKIQDVIQGRKCSNIPTSSSGSYETNDNNEGLNLSVDSKLRASWSKGGGRYANTTNGLDDSIQQPQASKADSSILFRHTTSAPSISLGGVTDGKSEETLKDGTRVVKFANGTVKRVSPFGGSVVEFANGDSKKTTPEGVTVYYYAQAKTTHTTFLDGTEKYEFPNGQEEIHRGDGSKEILFADGTRKKVYTNGLQESVFADGVVVREHPGGAREIVAPDGSVHRDN